MALRFPSHSKVCGCGVSRAGFFIADYSQAAALCHLQTSAIPSPPTLGPSFRSLRKCGALTRSVLITACVQPDYRLMTADATFPSLPCQGESLGLCRQTIQLDKPG